jgi:hypothetical protein
VNVHCGAITKVSAALTLALLLASCRTGPPRLPAIAEAYVGPAELKIRSDIPLDSPTVAVVRHGERLQILRQRRQLFLQVRTPSGAEGWTDSRQLLGSEEMSALQDLAEQARKMPSQGVATVYEELRVHTAPSRVSPSFLIIKEKERVDVLTHVVTQRTTSARKTLVPPAPKKKAAPKKPAKAPKYPPPPLPKPPGPPANWLGLSKTNPAAESEEPEEVAEAPEVKPVPVDDWSLIRTRSGQSGWALTGRLIMAIPDEVAQYAEGHRIVSYFSLGEVQDGDLKKHNWLWTTLAGRSQSYDFDSFRVFIWSLRRHRYETAYIERNLKGYQPVLLKEVPFSSGAPSSNQAAQAGYPGFSFCLEKADGQRYRREYAFLTNVVRFAGERPCEAAPAPPVGAAAPSVVGAPAPTPQASESFATKFKNKVAQFKRRIFGR